MIVNRKRVLIKELCVGLRRKDMLMEESAMCRTNMGGQSSAIPVDTSLADSLSDFRHKLVLSTLTDKSSGKSRMFDKTKDMLSIALQKSGESMNKIFADAYVNPSKISTLQCLSPRDGDIHFREIQNRLLMVRSQYSFACTCMYCCY